MAADENEQEHILGLESGEMMLLWQLHCPGMGQAVEITTGACTFRAHKQRDLIHRSRNVNSIHRQRTFPPRQQLLHALSFMKSRVLAVLPAVDSRTCVNRPEGKSLCSSKLILCYWLSLAVSEHLVLVQSSHCMCVAADLLSIVVYMTPAGTRDEGGAIQPAYINFDAALLEAPAHELKVSGCLHALSLQQDP